MLHCLPLRNPLILDRIKKQYIHYPTHHRYLILSHLFLDNHLSRNILPESQTSFLLRTQRYNKIELIFGPSVLYNWIDLYLPITSFLINTIEKKRDSLTFSEQANPRIDWGDRFVHS